MRIFLFIFFSACLGTCAFAQVRPAGGNWVSRSAVPKAFIENKGQFSERSGIPEQEILCMAEFGPQLYFTPRGILFSMSKGAEMTEDEKKKFLKPREGKREYGEGEEKPKFMSHTYFMHMEWVGADPKVKTVLEKKVKEYWNYLDPDDRTKSINRVGGYQKLTYLELYPGIDVEYVFHPEQGLKYSLILHPGADVSVVKMKYSNARNIFKDGAGNICYSTEAGSITDHAPETFYEAGRQPIFSKFSLKDSMVSFELGPYDHSQKVIIDPWMNSSLVPVNTPVDLGADASNNVYIYGFSGYQSSTIAITHYVQKFNAAGVLQWTFNFTNAMNFIQNTGDIAVDPAGNSYVSCGFYFISFFIFDCMQAKLDPAGTLMWNLQSPFLYENWRNSFNCDYTQLVQVGVGPGCCDVGHGDIINTSTGAESGVFNPPNTGDIVASSYGKNGYFYILSVVDQASNPAPHTPNLTCLDPANTFSVVFSNDYPVGPNFVDGFKTNYGTYGFNGLVAGCDFLYVCLGSTLEKRSLNTGALISSTAVPGGVLHGNAGTAVDNCGNIYVGSSKGVEVFSPNLVHLTTFATPHPVFDIVIGSGGMFYACGGVNTSNSNAGFVAQFSLTSVCNPTGITTTPNSCGASNIGTATATPLFCTGPYTYSWSTSPVQTTQTATGLAGGTYTVIVTGAGVCNDQDTAVATIPSGLLVVSVPPYVNVSCNGGSNGSASISVTGGTSPFTYTWNPTGQTASTATGLSAGSYSVTVTDASGCTGTQTVTISEPALLSATVSSTPASCGGTNGSATVAATGGTIGYTYNWNPSAQTTPAASNLTSGNYSITVTDANGCVTTQTVVVAPTGSITAAAGPNSTVCGGQTVSLSASGGTVYSWSTGQTSAFISVTPSSTSSYSVIVSSGSCSDTAFATVTVISSPSVSVAGITTLCTGGTSTLTASGGSTYFWNTGSSSSAIVVSPSVTTTYSVVASNGPCSVPAAITVVVTSVLVANVNNATICSGQNAILNASGGGSYSWSNGSNGPSISVFPSTTTTYTVIASSGSCSDTAVATVLVTPSASVSAWSNTTITSGSSTTLSATGGSSYIWSNGETSAVISVSPVVTTTYCVSGSDSCSDTACVIVYVVQGDNCNYDDDQLFVPDAFSPNGDTKNDVLGLYYPDPSCIKELEFVVYDRWGEKVFEATTITAVWDGSYKGKPMNTAVFVYYMKVVFTTDAEVIRKGNISLVR